MNILNPLQSRNLILTLIDFQVGFAPLIDSKIFNQARANILLLIKMSKRLMIPMLGTEHYRKGLGATDQILLNEWGGGPLYDKITFSCYGHEKFTIELNSRERSTVILTGLETHICVLQTALDLLANNYQVVVVQDAVLSSSKDKWKNGLSLMEKSGALIVNTETLLFYLLQRADTADFKYFVSALKAKNQSII